MSDIGNCGNCCWCAYRRTRFYCRYAPPTLDGFPIVMDNWWCSRWEREWDEKS